MRILTAEWRISFQVNVEFTRFKINILQLKNHYTQLIITSMKRLFIGIPVESVKVAEYAEKWKNDHLLNQNRLNWVKSENRHITLFFLGDTPEAEIDLLKSLIDESFNEMHSFTASLNGVGVFPNERNPKVFWTGCKNFDRLMTPYAKLSEKLIYNGFVFDNKPLKPHLTLARIKGLENRSSLMSILSQYHQYDFGTFSIQKIVLFESILTQKGPIYQSLFEKQLIQ